MEDQVITSTEDTEIQDKMYLFYFGFYILALLLVIPFLVKSGKGIWWYILLFLIVAPIIGSIGAITYKTVKK